MPQSRCGTLAWLPSHRLQHDMIWFTKSPKRCGCSITRSPWQLDLSRQGSVCFYGSMHLLSVRRQTNYRGHLHGCCRPAAALSRRRWGLRL